MPPAQPKKPEQARNSERNEYIPSFIAKKPFYITDDQNDDYLEHQRLQQSKSDSQWYDRGRKAGPAATKYRKGACENCGSMTHKAKDCLSRPRKAGAKWTGQAIEADEVVQDVSLGWEAKRDRWNGYDSREYQDVVDEFNELEELKRATKGVGGTDADGEDRLDDGDKYEEETDMGRQQSTATRNLRLREDTAKYLLNLDLDSAKYDPKTRSMVDSGGLGESDKGAALMAEEGFIRASGDAAEFDKAQKYAWETQERGDKNKVHLQANPTAGQLFLKKEKEEADKRKAAHKKALLEKYGGQEQFQSSTLKDTAVVENEKYVEYDERGLIKGQPEQAAKSKYAEDIYVNNHTSVWGSWWRDFHWGFACCHSTVKNSYCTGDTGKAAFSESDRLRSAADYGEQQEAPKELAWREERVQEEHVPDVVEKENKATEEQNRKRAFGEMISEADEKEMEEWRKKRVAANDPMAKMLGKDELVG